MGIKRIELFGDQGEKMVSKLAEKQREFFESGATRSYESRMANLASLKNAIKKHESEILAALKQDMNKPEMEGTD